MDIKFTLNGNSQSLSTEPDRRVIDLLREDLGLTGIKEGCGTGECGACTVLMDGETRLSCLTLAAQIDGRDITTIEGLQDMEEGIILQKAFEEQGAVQCGYCIPGMEMAALPLLTLHPNAARNDIKIALSGNLCRCTGYVKIVDAVEQAGREIAVKKEGL
ncbi:MAG: (2Fe-2S)-binding protein [Proteobacteria bacterium]|nr:(2Fe-2S)-binding protein [Pseudomonadota bacterium]